MNIFNLTKTEGRRKYFLDFAKPLLSVIYFSIPAMLGTLVVSSYEIIDKLIATHVGVMLWLKTSGLDTVISFGKAQSIINTVMGYSAAIYSGLAAFSFFISLGTGVHFAINCGARRYEKARYFFFNGLFLSFFLSLISIVVFNLILRPIINYEVNASNLGGELDSQVVRQIVFHYTFAYSQIFVFLSPLLYVSNFFLSIFRAEGKTYLSTMIILISLALNILLDFFFLGRLGTGLLGTAYATGIAWIFSIIISILNIRSFRADSPMKIAFRHFRLDKDIIFSILTMGITSLVQNMFVFTLSILAINRLSNLPFGTSFEPPIGIRIYSAIFPWVILLNSPLIGLTQAARPLVSWNYGRENYHRAFEIIKAAFLFLLAFSFFSQLIVFFFRDDMLMIYMGKSKEASEIIQRYSFLLIYQFLSFPLSSFYFISVILFQSVNRPFISFFCSVLRGFIFPIVAIEAGFFFACSFQSPVLFYLSLGVIDLCTLPVFLLFLLFAYRYFNKSQEKILKVL